MHFGQDNQRDCHVLSVHQTGEYGMSMCLYPGGVSLNHQLKEVSAEFSTRKLLYLLCKLINILGEIPLDHANVLFLLKVSCIICTNFQLSVGLPATINTVVFSWDLLVPSFLPDLL